MSRVDEFYDDDDESEEDSGRRLGLKIGLTLIVAAALLVGAARWIDETEPRDRASLPVTSIDFDTAIPAATSLPTRSIAETSTSIVQVLAPTGTRRSAASTTTASPQPASTTTPTTASPQHASTTAAITATSATTARVELIQTVPALRDFIVIIDGQPFSSDAAGTIVLPVSASGSIEIVGIRNEPPLWEVAFTSWSDGSTDTVRMLDTIAGPVAQIGLLLNTRVIATAQPQVPGARSAVLSTGDWRFTVPLDVPQWLPSARAVQVAGVLQEEVFTYTVTALLTNDGTRALTEQSFRATPEAVWVIAADSPTAS